MKRVRQLLLSIVGIGVLVLGLSPGQALAAGNTISLSASPTKVAKGSTLQIAVNASTTSSVVAAQAYITFDQTKFALQRVDYAIPFTKLPDAYSGEGYSLISAYTTEAPSGSPTLARMTFKALSGGSSIFGVSQENSSLYTTDGTGVSVLSSVSGVSLGTSLDWQSPWLVYTLLGLVIVTGFIILRSRRRMPKTGAQKRRAKNYSNKQKNAVKIRPKKRSRKKK